MDLIKEFSEWNEEKARHGVVDRSKNHDNVRYR